MLKSDDDSVEVLLLIILSRYALTHWDVETSFNVKGLSNYGR